MKDNLVFTVFADLHYKTGMYLSSVSDVEKILERAKNSSSDFLIHCGDFSNDYKGSAEVVNVFLKNQYDLSVYGVYGNHELESFGNTMQNVTPCLTNRVDEVKWGTKDEKISNGEVGYYYFDKGDFRIICVDTNYSYNTDLNEWQHNTEASWGPPNGNVYPNSLGPIQLKWLEALLYKSVEENKKCIVVSHATFNMEWPDFSPDSDVVCKLFDEVNNIKPSTVIMAINGHYHSNRISMKNGIVYFDVNTVVNGYWALNKFEHYEAEHTFECIRYNDEGVEIAKETCPLTSLSMSKHTWFFDSPLSAVVTISNKGDIKIEGADTKWIYGIIPETDLPNVQPKISHFEVNSI